MKQGKQAIQWRKYGGKEFLRGFCYNRYECLFVMRSVGCGS